MILLIPKKLILETYDETAYAPGGFIVAIKDDRYPGYAIKLSDSITEEQGKITKHPEHLELFIKDYWRIEAYKFKRNKDEVKKRFKRIKLTVADLLNYFKEKTSASDTSKKHVLYFVTNWIDLSRYKTGNVIPIGNLEIGIIHQKSIYSITTDVRHNISNKTVKIIKEFDSNELEKYQEFLKSISYFENDKNRIMGHLKYELSSLNERILKSNFSDTLNFHLEVIHKELESIINTNVAVYLNEIKDNYIKYLDKFFDEDEKMIILDFIRMADIEKYIDRNNVDKWAVFTIIGATLKSVHKNNMYSENYAVSHEFDTNDAKKIIAYRKSFIMIAKKDVESFINIYSKLPKLEYVQLKKEISTQLKSIGAIYSWG